MKIKPEQLKSTLSKQLSSLYFIFGPEPLLVDQSLSEVRSAAKTQGYGDKISFEIDGNFDWNQIIAEISSVSLFSPKRIIECRLKTGKLGVKGSKALSDIAASLPSDILFVISADKIDMAQQKSKWFKTLEKFGCIIQHWEIQNDHLVGWIVNHMSALGLESNPEIAKNIAFCTEGNLLAAMQEIEKLKIAYPDGKINVDDYLNQIAQQSKYSIYGLIDSALSGNAEQVLKIYESLIDDNAMPIQLSSSLYREINAIIEMSIELQQQQKVDVVLQKHRVWNKRKPIITHALKNHSYQSLQKILLLLGRIDRSIKGMDNLNVIDELRILLLNLAGKTPWAR